MHNSAENIDSSLSCSSGGFDSGRCIYFFLYLSDLLEPCALRTICKELILPVFGIDIATCRENETLFDNMRL